MRTHTLFYQRRTTTVQITTAASSMNHAIHTQFYYSRFRSVADFAEYLSKILSDYSGHKTATFGAFPLKHDGICMADATSPNVIDVIHDELVTVVSCCLHTFRAMQIDTEEKSSGVRDEPCYCIARWYVKRICCACASSDRRQLP